MERPIFKPVGTAEEGLDTPSLVVDISGLNQNIETMHSFFRSRPVGLRPHVSGHGSSAIAHMQIAAGGTVGGIMTATLGQAEVFAATGFDDIFLANLVTAPSKISRLCSLARRVNMTVAADSADNVIELGEASVEAGVTLNVVVDINTRRDSTGVAPGRPALELANTIEGEEGLHFAGLMTYEGTIRADGDELVSESKKCIQQVLDTREKVEKAGLDVEILSVGGTHNYEIAGDMDGVTEVAAGSYALMDEAYRPYRPQFVNAARIMSCVTSMPEAGNIITDAGRKAIGGDSGNPGIPTVPGGEVRGLSAEHGGIDLDPSIDHGLSLGDRVWFVPNSIEGCVNLHDYMHVIRNGKLDAIWELPARGRYR